MNRIFLAVFLIFGTSILVSAQKHAPRLSYQFRNLPGIYPEASKRLLKVSDIEGLTSWDLKIMRNEIYARHGYIFKTQEMIQYFNNENWYYPRFNNVEHKLSAIEKKNIKFIKSYE